MTVLAFGTRLSASAWAREVAKLEPGTRFGPEASEDNGEEVEVDLSYARSADFLVLGRLLVLIQALAVSGVKILIRMPVKGLLEVEQSYLLANNGLNAAGKEAAERQISRHQIQRINCRLFIEQSGFDAALRGGPLSARKVTIVESEGGRPEPITAAGPGVEWDQYDKPRSPLRRRGIIPFRWLGLSEPSAKATDLVEPLFRSIAALGLPVDDAAALAQGVAAEVIENSKDHGEFRHTADAWILAGAELTHPQSYTRRVDDFDLYMRDLVTWAAKEPSPLLRLFMGDAGGGIKGPILEAVDLHAAHDSVNRSPCGLWKATRVVRSFQGSFVIASQAEIAGYIFDAAPEGEKVLVPAPAWVPGTLVECTVLTAPGRAIRPFEEEISSPAPISESAVSTLSCATVVLRPNLGLDTDDTSTIQYELDRLRRVPEGGLVIAVEMPTRVSSAADADIGAAIGAVLDIASMAANPSTITLVFAGVSRILLGLAVDALNRSHDAEGAKAVPRLQSPVLVVSSENTHYWAGGTPRIRQLLSTLSQSPATRLPISGVAEALDVEEDATLEREIRDQPRLLHLDKGAVALKLRPQDATKALAKYFSEHLASAVAQADTPGVRKGLYLTTSLRVTGRWLNVRELLENLHSYQLAGFLLANAVANRTGGITRSPKPSVVCVGSIGKQLVSVFSLALTGTNETFESVSALRMSREMLSEGANQPITICTDIMSRGSYVRRVVRQLWDMGFSHVSVAAVIDGRDLPHRDEKPEFILVRGIEVPVTSLARVSLDADERAPGQEPVPIDPVTGTPLPGSYPQSQIVGSQRQYITAVRASGAARLGHIYRPGQRHYTANISMSALFGNEPWARKTLDRIVSYIREDHRLVRGADDDKVAVIYAAETRDDFREVVYALVDTMRKEGIDCDPVPIPRSSAGGDWAFPRFAELPAKATHIVAIDSTSKTGRTLRELIRLASLPTTRFISCFGLIHGMSDLEAISLQQIRQVAPYGPDGPFYLAKQLIPVRVRHWVRTAVSSSDAAKCPLCALRNAYTSLPSALPKSLDEHRLRLGDILRARSRESVFRELETDHLGVHITQEDCIEYLKWRSSIEEARFSTASRAALVRRLRRLADAISKGYADEHTTRQRDALVRLMAAEHNRLEQAPIWFTSVRSMLVEAARSLLEVPVSLAVDPMLRVQALIVIARADVPFFCAHYAEIVRMCRQHETVLAHSFVEALVLLTQEWSNATWRGVLAEQVSMLTDEVKREQSLESSWAFRPAEELAYLAALATRGRLQPANSKQQAWAALKKFCDSVRSHRYDQAMWRLQRRLEYTDRELPTASRESAFKDWRQCSAAIDEEVLPNLSILRAALCSNQVLERRLLSAGERQKWLDIVDGSGQAKLNEITVAVGNVFLRSDPRTVPQEELEHLKDALATCNDFFFQSVPAPDNPAGDSILCDIAGQCPADLLEVIKDVFAGSTWDLRLRGVEDNELVPAFCASSALLDALTHVRMNAEVTHREEGGVPKFRIEIFAVDPESIVVNIFNSATSRTTRGGGRGLATVAESLACFDAYLEPIEEVPPGWTYGVRFVFERWKWR